MLPTVAFLRRSGDAENLWGPSPRKRMRLPSNTLGRATNVTIQQHKVGRDERAQILGRHSGFRGCTIWFTGFSGAGKTTIAMNLEKVLTELGIPAYVLDGDNIRHGLCKNLGFTKEERTENIRRVAEVSKLFADMGVVVLASFISPFQMDRDEARLIHEQGDLQFLEVYVNTSLEVCEARDTKKLYQKARAGKLQGLTGIDGVYEVPKNPDLVIEAGTETEAESVQRVLQFLYQKKVLPDRAMQHLCGSPVRSLQVSAERATILAAEVMHLPAVALSLVDLQWLQVLAEGWASPLSGFMRQRQYLQWYHNGLLFDLKTKCKGPEEESSDEVDDPIHGITEPINQSVPIVLAIDDAQRAALFRDGSIAQRIVLTWEGRPIAVMNQPEVYIHRKEERIARQFGITDSRHPTIQLIRESGNWLLGGDLEVLERIRYNDGLDEYRLTPAELRERFTAAGADSIFAFQLRNPIHNGHALLMADTRAQLLRRYRNPMLLLHPLGGWTKDDDVPLAVRMDQHRAVLEEGGLLDPAWTVLAIFPSPMLYAGPNEVQWHARARLAAGITAYIVGRDPAGIQHPETGDFLYDPTHGAKVLSMAPGLGHLEIVPFRVAAYDKAAGQMSFFDPKRKDDFDFISGTRMRNLARTGEQPPDGFMVPAAWKVLADYYRRLCLEASSVEEEAKN